MHTLSVIKNILYYKAQLLHKGVVNGLTFSLTK